MKEDGKGERGREGGREEGRDGAGSKALGIQSKFALCRKLSRLASTGFVSLSNRPLDGTL